MVIDGVSDAAAKGPEKHLVVLVHGINTNAQWFGVVLKTLSRRGFIAVPSGYGIYGIVRFLLPFDWVTKRAVEKVSINIRAAIYLHKPDKISIIAHSFGTFIIFRILAEEFDIDLHRIIFCGSVVDNDFPLQKYLHQFKNPIFNEIGTRDYWPVVAAALTWSYGSVGADGFQRAGVRDRWHKDFRHSDFLTQEFCEKFFIPSLLGEEVDGDDAVRFPLWVQFLARVHFITRPLAALAICSLLFFGASFVFRNAPSLDSILVLLARSFERPEVSKPPQPPQPSPPDWRQLPDETRFMNGTRAPVPLFSDEKGTKLDSSIAPGEVVPGFGMHGRWESAKIGDEEWLRIALPNGGHGYVRKGSLQPWK
jgi:pimeloyl-ACP methyl ester carboxylesterase